MKKLFFFLLFPMMAVGQQWQTDFAQAQTQAAAASKNILLVFSGSDWCAPCIKLDQSIWQSPEFKATADDWTLVKADFPKKRAHLLSSELQKQNGQLAEKYNAEGNFPLVVLLDPKGKVLGKIGYNAMKPQPYLDLINAFEHQ